MARIIWDKTLDTGIAIIDKQHQKLAILFNQINQVMEDGASLTALKSSIQEISLYAEYHFKTEEDLMTKANFVGLAGHQEQHLFFKKKAGEILKNLEDQQEASNISVQASSLLWEWFLGHVKETDRDYIEPIKTVVSEQATEKNESIELLAEHEEAIMHLYLAYSEYLPNKDFWIGLAAEEMHHAYQIRNWYEMIKEANVFISQRFKDQALRLSKGHLEQKINEAKMKQIDELNAMGIALDIERALLEKNFFESYESDSIEFKHQIKEMNEDIRLHIKRVESEIKALKEKIAEEEMKKQGAKPLGSGQFLA